MADRVNSGCKGQNTKMTRILKLPGGQAWDQQGKITREEGTSWVIEGLAGHMKDFDIYPLGSPQPERIFFLSDLGSGGECEEEGED